MSQESNRHEGLLVNVGALLILLIVFFIARPYLSSLSLAVPASFEGKPGLQGGAALNDDGNVDFPNSVRSSLPLIKEAGAGWVRISFRLGGHFRDWTTKDSRGISAIEYYDVLVDEARTSYGLRVLGLLSNESWRGSQSDWIANNAERARGNGDNTYLKAFSKQAAVVLTEHFAGRVDDWEVWNEPNAFTALNDGEPQGGSFIYPSNFAQLLRHVDEDTRHLPNLRIVSGGILAADIGFQLRREVPAHVLRSHSGGQYLAETYRQGRQNANWEEIREKHGSYPLDGVGIHIYIDQDRTTTRSKIEGFLEEFRDAYVAFEGPRTPKRIVVTEFGWATSVVSQRVQAENLQIAYATFKGLPYVQNAYWFLAQDVAAGSVFYGLQTAGESRNQYRGVPKLALEAYQEAAVYRPGTTILGLKLGSSSPLRFVGKLDE